MSDRKCEYSIAFDAVLATYADGRQGWLQAKGLRKRLQRGVPKGTWHYDRKERCWFRSDAANA